MEFEMGSIATTPLREDFGVEVTGLDVARADAATLAEIKRQVDLHGALVIRGQSLDPDQLLAFTRVFGEPAGNALLEYTVSGHPEIYVISNKVVDGRAIGDPEAGTAWHTDLNYAARPAAYTLLYALDVPPEGSDTLIADTCAAWNALPEEEQRRIDGLKVHHSYANLAVRANRTLSEEEKREFPDVFHPLIRRHPADGRKTIWGLSSTTPNGIVGMPNPEGKDLIRGLLEFTTQERFVYRHKWQVGDVLLWDNRCTLHRGTPFDKQRHIRHVHRTWVRGEVPQ
ncbi:MAG: TauD/TfdA family dioxygenase [Rhodospirillaceae bacterium]|nr:TauD/TfdA family dioxygenase [Rhodospirillaceae bacterium]